MITEDIIKQALNESIDEFMLEEGAWDNLKDWYNNGNGKYLKNAVNWGKNAIANYMDKRTNGEWNRKYNVYADNTGKSIRSKNKWDYYRDLYAEQSYLTTWFNTHAKNVNKILRFKNGPNYSLYGKNNFFNSSVWMGITGATQYIQTYCTYDNFVDYTKQYFTDYQGNPYIKNFILNEILACADKPQICLNKLNMRYFNTTKYGKGFYNQSMEKRNKRFDSLSKKQSQQQSQQQTNQQGNKPVPNNKNGTFNVGNIECPQKRGWFYSTDANGKNILVNASDPKQAIFF